MTLEISADGRTFERVATRTVRAGRTASFDVGGRTVVALRLRGRTRLQGLVAEVSMRAAGPPEPQAPSATPAQADGVAPDDRTSSSQSTAPSAPADTTPSPSPTPTRTPRGARAEPPTGALPSGPAPPAQPSAGRSFAGVLNAPIDPRQLTAMPFGTRSHWLQPWRAYLDTPTTRTLRDALGINFNVATKDASSVARLLAASGFARARIEIGWGDVSPNDPSVFVHAAEWREKLTALRDAGIRPLLLLNSNDGRPCPARDVSLRITAPVPAGARTVRLDAASAASVVPGRTGFNTDQGAGLLITAVAQDGTATLAHPMPIAVPANTYPGMTLAYEPFSPLDTAAGQRTLAGWLSYVKTATTLVRSVLGTNEFDVEIWNELNFGSAFLDINNYYAPPIASSTIGDDTIRRRTSAWLKDPANGLAGVRVGNGFASQRPWDNGDDAAGLDAIDRHFYPQNRRFPSSRVPNRPLDAHGNTMGWEHNGWHDLFVPTYDAFFPEYYLTGISTETVLRDLAPWTEMIPNLDGGVDRHGRTTAPPGGTPPELWMTELGLDTTYAEKTLGHTLSDADRMHIRAKSTLRALTSFVNKGMTQIDFYAAGTADWGLVSGAFYDQIAWTGGFPGIGAGGKVMDTMRRLTAHLGSAEVTRRRSLSLASVGDYAGRLQFTGDGTSGRPDLRDRDVLAVLPFQAADHRFVVPVYVMTRSLARRYDGGAAGGDPRRFDLPAERYQLTLGGVQADRARVSAIDPLSGEVVPVEVVRRDPNGWLVVELPVTDSPRLLTIDDGPV